jgi:hypothetical protein
MKYCWILLIGFVLLGVNRLAHAQNYDHAAKHQCLKCHAFPTYSFLNEISGKEEKRLMNPYFVLDTVAMSAGVHKVLDCTDCHSSEYAAYPHKSTLKLEPLNSCLDCHGGDEAFASYKFEKIEEEFKKSIHYKIYGSNFSCSKCHDQHTYVPTARNSSDVHQIVSYSNKMCLSCHNNMAKYELVADHANPQLVKVHSWLPNQELHFKNVRCIECHTAIDTSLLVSHDILPKEQAVRKCDQCHSVNSRLKATLYKYRNLQERAEKGTFSAVLSNESYVIGTQQVPLLKLISIIIFIAVLLGILTHSIFRILKKK